MPARTRQVASPPGSRVRHVHDRERRAGIECLVDHAGFLDEPAPGGEGLGVAGVGILDRQAAVGDRDREAGRVVVPREAAPGRDSNLDGQHETARGGLGAERVARAVADLVAHPERTEGLHRDVACGQRRAGEQKRCSHPADGGHPSLHVEVLRPAIDGLHLPFEPIA